MTAFPKPDGALQYRLTCRFKDGSAQSLVVTDEPITIGRTPNAHFCLDDAAVSRSHCVILSVPGRLMMLDQGSTNGTMVNGVRVQQARLKHGDVVQIGSAKISVRAETLGKPSNAFGLPRDTSPPMAGFALLPEEQVRFLRRLASRLSCVDSSAGAADTLLDGALAVFPAGRVVLFFAPISGPTIPGLILASRGELDWETTPPSKELICDVVTSGKAEHRRQVHPRLPGPVYVAPGSPRRPRYTDVLCAPIRLGRQGCCVLYLEADDMPEWARSAEMLELLSGMAKVAGPAIGRGILLDERVRQEGSPVEGADRPGDEAAPTQRDKLETILDDLCGPYEPPTDTESSREIALELDGSEQLSIVQEQRIELMAQLTELEHLQRTRAQMARGLVHDIKNLVTALDANLYLIGHLLDRSQEGQDLVESAKSCVGRIHTLAQDVLEVQRMEEGKYVLSTHELDLGDVIGDAIARYSGRAEQQGVRLEQATGVTNSVVRVDHGIITRVLDNLLDNALAHAGTKGWVRLGVHPTLTHIELVVTDSGPGVPPDHRDKIFVEWYRGEHASARQHGIGLYFCRLAVEAHGGSIRVEGEPGNNRFVVALPAASDSDSDTLTMQVGDSSTYRRPSFPDEAGPTPPTRRDRKTS